MRPLLLTLILVGCPAATTTPDRSSADAPQSNPDVPAAEDTPRVMDVIDPVGINLADPERVARGEVWFHGAAPGQGLIPALAVRHLYLSWEGSLLTKLPYFQNESGYWKAFKERYGFLEAPFDNDGYPLGIRRSQNPASVTVDCLACHAGEVAGLTVIGAANNRLRLQPFYDDLQALPAAVEALKKANLPEPYGTLIKNAPLPAEVPMLPGMVGRTGAPGVTDAMGLGTELTMVATGKSGLSIDYGFQDPPAWWTLPYKQRTYTDGAGQVGGYRTMMATLLAFGLTWAEYQALDDDFEDISHYLLSLKPPMWSDAGHEAPDPGAVAAGEAVYSATCAGCHGTGISPNVVVSADEVGTDPLRTTAMTQAEADLFNSLTVSASHAMTPTDGYLAPPLVGIWASAPYLHNGSVPTLAMLLEPATRPVRWVATGGYDVEKVGLAVTEVDAGHAAPHYDTTIVGLSAAGHDYGDALDAADREALLAFLKTM